MLCKAGCKIIAEVLDTTITKNDDGTWSGVEDKRLSAGEMVEEMWFCISEDHDDADRNTFWTTIEPVDEIAIKKEVANGGSPSDSHCSTDEAAPHAAMKLAEYEWDDDAGDYVEVATFDGGARGPVQADNMDSCYKLPLHLRCLSTEKPKKPKGSIAPSPSPSPSPSPPPPPPPPPLALPLAPQVEVRLSINCQSTVEVTLVTLHLKRWLPSEGMVVTVRGETGFVFRVVDNQKDPSKRGYAICYVDRTWEAHYESTATPWNSASTIPDELPSGAVTRKVGRHVFPEGFLYGSNLLAMNGCGTQSTGWGGQETLGATQSRGLEL